MTVLEFEDEQRAESPGNGAMSKPEQDGHVLVVGQQVLVRCYRAFIDLHIICRCLLIFRPVDRDGVDGEAMRSPEREIGKLNDVARPAPFKT
jgi:hypothetical protein